MAQPQPQPIANQDPVTVDPKHYGVETENEQVRVLRARYEPGEKSVMHSHPAVVAIFLTDGECRFTFPDGTTEDHSLKAGQTMYMPAMAHLPENTGTKAFEVIVIELKK
jgi:quercetin dioxygenase-like cupin family protein